LHIDQVLGFALREGTFSSWQLEVERTQLVDHVGFVPISERCDDDDGGGDCGEQRECIDDE
jgi:hypothetical protein